MIALRIVSQILPWNVSEFILSSLLSTKSKTVISKLGTYLIEIAQVVGQSVKIMITLVSFLHTYVIFFSVSFFAWGYVGLKIKPNGITLLENDFGRCTGDGFVEFASADSLDDALAKHRDKIGHRWAHGGIWRPPHFVYWKNGTLENICVERGGVLVIGQKCPFWYIGL